MSSDNGAAGSDELTGLAEDGDVRTEDVAAAEAALAVDPEVEAAATDDTDSDTDDDVDAPVET
ncbi:MAG: RNA polymerase subunit sigma, partial [Actinomycetota bacterium]|nr:RNA polymerase subunit sigma [Actinomycetota bacterium]